LFAEVVIKYRAMRAHPLAAESASRGSGLKIIASLAIDFREFNLAA